MVTLATLLNGYKMYIFQTDIAWNTDWYMQRDKVYFNQFSTYVNHPDSTTALWLTSSLSSFVFSDVVVCACVFRF